MSCRFEEQVSAFFKKYHLSANDNFVVAFSGGADSLSLLIALFKLGFKNIEAVYVNHNLRSNAELEREIKLNTVNAEKLNFPLKFFEIEKGLILRNATKNNVGIEAEARSQRLSILENEAKKFNNAYILTGHNRNDADEWEIISFFRGNLSVQSMKEKRDNYLRPLLNITHKEAIEYCRAKGFEYSEDSTNSENEHLRNKVRNILIPKISEVFPSFEKSFSIRRLFDEFDNEKEIPINKGEYFGIPSVIINTKDMEGHSKEKLKKAILDSFGNYKKDTNGGRISLSSVYDVLSLLRANTSTVLLKYGVYVFKTSFRLDSESLVFMKKANVDSKIASRDKGKTYVKEGIKIKTKSGNKAALKILKDKKVPSVLRPLITLDEAANL